LAEKAYQLSKTLNLIGIVASSELTYLDSGLLILQVEVAQGFYGDTGIRAGVCLPGFAM
jgi:hypothetical protein